MAYLELKNVCKSYGEGKNKTEVLRNINLKIEEGEFVAIVGFTGSGKTTLVNLLAGLIEPDSGEILFKGQPISGTSHERGIIFQNYSLLPWLSVYENIAMAVKAVFPAWTNKEVEAHVISFIEKVNLAHATHKKPREPSGGMRQRVAVARALVNNPSIILADEPSGNLDTESAENLHNLFFKLRDEFGQTFVIVTHNEELAAMADRKLVMQNGVII